MNDSLPPSVAYVASYYDQQPETEWQRLERHRTEYEITMRALLEYLPPPPARILDCGGGPGRYAIELTRRGYQVTLFDLSSSNLQFARAKAEQAGVTLAGYELGNATDLSRFPDESFEAVLIMGPLYHLLELQDRRKALCEGTRVLKAGGYLFAAFVGRYAPFRFAAAEDPGWLVREPNITRAILETGKRPDDDLGRSGFLAYYTHPAEIEPFFRGIPLEVRAILAVEGLISRNGEKTINELHGAAWEAWMELNYRAAPDASIRGAVEHMLVVATRPLWRQALRQVVLRLAGAGLAYKVVGGASLALHGIPLAVKDVDIETSAEGAYRFEGLFASSILQPVALSESDRYRSHFGRFEIEGQVFEVMGDLQRREAGAWKPTFTRTQGQVDLDGAPVLVSWLEEETLAYIRRGRMNRAALCLPYCDHGRLLALLRGEVAFGVL